MSRSLGMVRGGNRGTIHFYHSRQSRLLLLQKRHYPLFRHRHRKMLATESSMQSRNFEVDIRYQPPGSPLRVRYSVSLLHFRVTSHPPTGRPLLLDTDHDFPATTQSTGSASSSTPKVHQSLLFLHRSHTIYRTTQFIVPSLTFSMRQVIVFVHCKALLAIP